MSQVLALKAGVKRPFDDMATDTTSQPLSCTPHRISFLESPAAKRLRHYRTPSHHHHYHHQQQQASSSIPRKTRTEVDEELVQHVPKRLRKLVVQVVAKGASSSERIFTIDDVKEIVHNVCEEKVRNVKQECEKVIEERLTDQWKVFTRYHEDFVARSYRGRDISYLS